WIHVLDGPDLTLLRDDFGPAEQSPAAARDQVYGLEYTSRSMRERGGVALGSDSKIGRPQVRPREACRDLDILDHLEQIRAARQQRVVDVVRQEGPQRGSRRGGEIDSRHT